MTGPLLPDVLEPGLRCVICGTGAGKRSAEVGAYYAGNGNKFWAVIHQVGLTPVQIAPPDFRAIRRYGIGLTDLNKFRAGADSGRGGGEFDVEAFKTKIGRLRPRVVAFNGKKAASVFWSIPSVQIKYGLQPASIGSASTFVLPSTSGAACRYWSEEPWYALKELLDQI